MRRLYDRKQRRKCQVHLKAPNVVISEEEQQRILTSDTFHHFLSRSSKIVERALDEDYDVLVDYTKDVESNQYPPTPSNPEQPMKPIKSNKSSHSIPNNG